MSSKYLVPFSNRNILSPFVESFQNLFDHAFDKLELKSPWFDERPKANAYTKEGKYTVEVQVPGMNESNINVSVREQNGLKYLDIEGKTETSREEKNYDFREYTYASFKRSFIVPDTVVGEPDASLHDGLLTVEWKVEEMKKEESGPKKIPIRKLET